MPTAPGFNALTMTVDGIDGIFFGTYTPDEYERIAAALIGGLPAGWKVYHLTGQDDPRLPALRAMPLLVAFNALAGGDTYANPLTELKRIGRIPWSFEL